MPPPHIDLPFTHNTLTFSFACLGRHCPIRIHQTCRLSHADFDLFFLPPRKSHNCVFSTVEIFLSLPLSLLVCLCIAISLPKYYLLGSRQTDFGWVTQCVWYHQPSLSPLSPPPPLSLLMPLRCFSQPKRAKEGVASLSMNSFPHTFPLLLPSASSHLRQSDIYRGTLHLLGSSCSFWQKNTQ